jgi:hypothetical protein
MKHIPLAVVVGLLLANSVWATTPNTDAKSDYSSEPSIQAPSSKQESSTSSDRAPIEFEPPMSPDFPTL